MTLQLTARIEDRNERHARIGVFQNGAKAGVLTVEDRYAEAVVARIAPRLATPEQVDEARSEYEDSFQTSADHGLRIDDDSPSWDDDDDGVWMQAWVWLPNPKQTGGRTMSTDIFRPRTEPARTIYDAFQQRKTEAGQ